MLFPDPVFGLLLLQVVGPATQTLHQLLARLGRGRAVARAVCGLARRNGRNRRNDQHSCDADPRTIHDEILSIEKLPVSVANRRPASISNAAAISRYAASEVPAAGYSTFRCA